MAEEKRNDDGHLINDDGALINDAGKLVNSEEKLVNSEGKLVDGEGKVIVPKKVVEQVVKVKIEIPKVEDGKTYDSAAVQKMINDAVASSANTTKNQLHANLTKLNEKIISLEEAGESVNSDEAIKKLLAEKKITDTEFEALKGSVGALENLLVEEKVKMGVLTDGIKEKSLNEFRDKLVKAADGRIIKELVTGKTEDELTAAADIAKSKFEEYQKETRIKLGLPEEKLDEEGKIVKPEEDKPVKIERINTDAGSLKDWKQKSDALKAEIRREVAIRNK